VISPFLLIAIASAPPPTGAARPARVPFSLIVCDGEGLPTLTLDHHDDHRLVRFVELGEPGISFDLIDPEFRATGRSAGPGRGWHVVATGRTQRAAGVEAGVPAAIELFVRLDENDDMSYSYTVTAGRMRRDLTGCLSPPPPQSHPAQAGEP
jgi:hypothetical protein